MRIQNREMAEQGSPWKEALEHYFEPFLALFFPDIDWTRGHEWLTNELQKMARKDEIGKRAVDLLVKVWLKTAANARC